MSWAAKEGISSPRRPKLLHAMARKRLLRMLERGEDKVQAAAAINVSIQTVTRILMTEPGLSDSWKSARFKNAQSQARKAWSSAMSSFPSASSVQWRLLEPAAYAWLYRNNRSWLQEAIQSRPIPTQISNRRRDWEQRDTLFSQAIRLAALKFWNAYPSKRLTLGELFSIVKGLRKKQSALHKLPLTQAAIQVACSATRPQLQNVDSLIPSS